MHEIKESSPASAPARAATDSLRRILPADTFEAGDFRLELSRSAVARLVREHVHDDPASAEVLRWYPSFAGHLRVIPINASHVSIEIAGTYTPGTGPLNNAHWERQTVRDALHVLLHMLTHSVGDAYRRAA